MQCIEERLLGGHRVSIETFNDGCTAGSCRPLSKKCRYVCAGLDSGCCYGFKLTACVLPSTAKKSPLRWLTTRLRPAKVAAAPLRRYCRPLLLLVQACCFVIYGAWSFVTYGAFVTIASAMLMVTHF